MNARAGRVSAGGAARWRRAAVWLVLAATVAALRAAGAAPAGIERTLTQGNVKATFTIPGESVPRFGFVPVHVAVDNREGRELAWDLRFTQATYSNAGGIVMSRSTQALTVPASRRSEHRIYVPVGEAGAPRGTGTYGWTTLQLLVSGTALRPEEIAFNAGPRAASGMAPWAVAQALEGAVRARLTALTRESTVTRGGRTVPGPVRPLIAGAPNLTAFDPAQPAGDWRAWSPFSRVILPAEDYAAMPPANRVALRHWVALGGALYLVPAKDAPGGTERHGIGVIVRMARPLESDPTAAGLFDPATPFRRTPVTAGELAMTKGGMEAQVPKAQRAGDWMVYFFVGFAVLIGPVNLFAIAAGRRRHWLFVTVPAISLAAVAILGGAIFLQDGTGGEGVRRSLVVLLPGDHHAAVFQEQVARTGLLFGTGFPLAEDTVCAALPMDEGTAGRALELARNGGTAAGDWFRGRARQAHHLRRIVPTRARVERVGTGPDGAPVVQSTVGATLRDFRVVDGDGLVWTADRVPAGVRTTLQRAREQRGGMLLPPGDFGNEVGTSDFDKELVGLFWRRRPAEPFRFLALAEESDLAPIATHPGIRWKDSAVLITGVLESAGAAGKATP